MTFVPNRNLINKSLADQSHVHTSWYPEKRSEQEIQGFVEYVQNVYESMQKYAKTDAQKESLDAEMQRYQAGYAQKYNADLAAKGRTFSSMITGGSNFPTRRHEKANQAEQNRYDEMKEWDDRAQASIIRELKKLSIAEAGGEMAVMKQKIADAEEAQENYKKINVILRKKNLSDDAKVQEIIAATGYKESTARNMFKKDFAGRTGIPSYVLTNNLANVHRMKLRLAELEKKESTPTGELGFDGGTIIDNAEADRIQIIYDKIPSEEIRAKLKGSGWKWSPKNSAWQRMRTRASMDSAQRITGAIEKKTEVQEIKQELKQGETVQVPATIIKLDNGFKFTPASYSEYIDKYPWGMYKIQMIAGTMMTTPEQNLEQINQWMQYHNYNDTLINEWNDEVKAEGQFSAEELRDKLRAPEKIYIKKELAHGETVEVPKADIPGLMKKGTLPDPDWEFEKQVDERIKIENEREVNPDDYYRDYETEKGGWGEDSDEIRQWMDFEAYKELELNKTIEIPETTLKTQISAPSQKDLWEMTYQEFAAEFMDKYNDSGYSFAERIGKPLGVESQAGEPLRIINGKKRGYPQSLIRDRWRYVILQDAINRGKKLSTEIMSDYLENQKNFPILLEGSAKPVIAEVKKEVSKGETVVIPEFKLIAGLRPTGKIERFDKGKEYIGIKYKGKNFRGEWEERMGMTKHHGRPYSVAEWDSIIEYTPEKWAELKELIQKEANANNRDAREDSLNVTVLQVPRWKSTPKSTILQETKQDIAKGATVTIPEPQLKPILQPMKNIVATYRKLGWDAKEKGKYKQAAQFYEIAIKDYEIHPATGEMYKADLANLKKLHAEMLSLSKVEKGETVEVPETVIAKALEPTPTIEGARWRKLSDHKSETKAVKEALNKAGIEAEVGHGRGTGWGRLEINIGDPIRDGFPIKIHVKDIDSFFISVQSPEILIPILIANMIFLSRFVGTMIKVVGMVMLMTD